LVKSRTFPTDEYKTCFLYGLYPHRTTLAPPFCFIEMHVSNQKREHLRLDFGTVPTALLNKPII
jgi:hypothetical protein